MKIKNNSKLILDAIFIIVAIGTFLLPFTGSAKNEDLAYSSLRSKEEISQGLPIRLRIPVIGVDSAIEDALITPEGRMDITAGSVNVAWFALGSVPGEVGSAVIGGHYGIADGVSSVFYDLHQLKTGDKIYVVNDKNDTFTFQVRSMKSFDRNADATNVFTSTDGLSHLNLITCEGIWNQVNGSYPLRLVVFTDAVPDESALGIASIVANFHQTLRVGSRGMNVMALQTFLQQKGFLISLLKIIDGIFGPKTRAAVILYQTEVGLLADGIFGPLTRAKLIFELLK